MIRKPKADDFREGMAVTVLRGSKMIAVETGKGARDGISKIATYWLVGTMVFGLLMSLIPALGGFGFLALVVIVGVVVASVRKNGATKSVNMSGEDRLARLAGVDTRIASPIDQCGQLKLDTVILTRRSISLLLPALFLFLLARMGLPAAPLMAIGVAMFALGILTGSRIFSDRTVLRYDGRSVTVTGFLGSGEMMWIDVDDISVQKCSRFNLPIIFSAGGRRNLVISTRYNRLGGTTELYVPIDLLGLDHEQLVALVSKLLCYRAGMGEAIPAAERPAPAPRYDSVPDEGFDPDAIMARYLAERSQVIAEVRPDLQQRRGATRSTFGRKSL